MRRSALLLAGLVLALPACASSPASAGGEDRAAARPTSSRNVLTSEELDAAPQANLRDVVRALRPLWLQNNVAGQRDQVAVYVNGQPLGGLESLSTMQKGAVSRLQFYGLADAQSRFGASVRTAVIEVRLRTGGE